MWLAVAPEHQAAPWRVNSAPCTGRVVRNLNFITESIIIIIIEVHLFSSFTSRCWSLCPPVFDCSAELSGHRQSFTLDIHGQLACKSDKSAPDVHVPSGLNVWLKRCLLLQPEEATEPSSALVPFLQKYSDTRSKKPSVSVFRFCLWCPSVASL